VKPSASGRQVPKGIIDIEKPGANRGNQPVDEREEGFQANRESDPILGE
jgi:hypothetical protein